MHTYNKNRFIISAVAFIALAGGILTLALRSSKGSSAALAAGSVTNSDATSTTNTASIADTTQVAPADKYKNGTYSAVGHYDSPGGYDGLNVTLTIKNDTVTAANVTSAANDPMSERYQQRFISGYQAYVIGQSVDSIQLDRVSGSSLTPIGFNDALSQIKAQAAQA
ncbi:MAG: hypothetical protein KGI79_00135 [Patescibacteria group bacterium]|nr:hypothetical protein [Patescibacteria group bacterium]MDE2116279.1 hypothetical protein [Patescibacteria group bacterium]